MLGHEVTLLAYPYGTRRTVSSREYRLAKAAGYQAAFWMRLARYLVAVIALRCPLQGAGDGLAGVFVRRCVVSWICGVASRIANR